MRKITLGISVLILTWISILLQAQAQTNSYITAVPAMASHSNILAIIGGEGNAPYAAFVKTDGSVAALAGLPLVRWNLKNAFRSS